MYKKHNRLRIRVSELNDNVWKIIYRKKKGKEHLKTKECIGKDYGNFSSGATTQEAEIGQSL